MKWVNQKNLNFNLRIQFEEKEDAVICVIFTNNRKFKGIQKFHSEYDRISPVKRAKQKAFVRAAAKFIGYVCDVIKINS